MYRRLDFFISKSLRNDNFIFSILIIDLDNFKYYNDTFGHDVGDETLKLFANFLSNILRENDIKVRYGGEEFILLLENNLENSIDIGNKIILELKKYRGFQSELSTKFNKNLNIEENKWISCSIGVTEYNTSTRKSPEEIIKLADDALYKAKKSGKSRVEY